MTAIVQSQLSQASSARNAEDLPKQDDGYLLISVYSWSFAFGFVCWIPSLGPPSPVSVRLTFGKTQTEAIRLAEQWVRGLWSASNRVHEWVVEPRSGTALQAAALTLLPFVGGAQLSAAIQAAGERSLVGSSGPPSWLTELVSWKRVLLGVKVPAYLADNGVGMKDQDNGQEALNPYSRKEIQERADYFGELLALDIRGHGHAAIALKLGADPSTVSLELQRLRYTLQTVSFN